MDTGFDPLTSSTLVSWKEIAAYLGRGVRTVQRWEKTMQLPIHRFAMSKSGVFAYPAEIEAWLREASHSTPKPTTDWRELAEMIVHEDDPERVLQLVEELNRLLSLNNIKKSSDQEGRQASAA